MGGVGKSGYTPTFHTKPNERNAYIGNTACITLDNTTGGSHDQLNENCHIQNRTRKT